MSTETGQFQGGEAAAGVPTPSDVPEAWSCPRLSGVRMKDGDGDQAIRNGALGACRGTVTVGSACGRSGNQSVWPVGPEFGKGDVLGVAANAVAMAMRVGNGAVWSKSWTVRTEPDFHGCAGRVSDWRQSFSDGDIVSESGPGQGFRGREFGSNGSSNRAYRIRRPSVGLHELEARRARCRPRSAMRGRRCLRHFRSGTLGGMRRSRRPVQAMAGSWNRSVGGPDCTTRASAGS